MVAVVWSFIQIWKQHSFQIQSYDTKIKSTCLLLHRQVDFLANVAVILCFPKDFSLEVRFVE